MMKRILCVFIVSAIGLLAKIALQQASKACTMTGLVLGSLVNHIVNSIEAHSLGLLGQFKLVSTSTLFGSSTLLQIGLGIENNLA